MEQPDTQFIDYVIAESGAAARLRSKQHLMSTLVERARDQSAYTRARVMQTWATLASSRSIDMGHWNCVTDLAIGVPCCFTTREYVGHGSASGCYMHGVDEHVRTGSGY